MDGFPNHQAHLLHHVSPDGSFTGSKIDQGEQQENTIEASAHSTDATMEETIEWILSTEGYDGLQRFFSRMPTQQLEALLASSERMSHDLFDASSAGAIPPQSQHQPTEFSRGYSSSLREGAISEYGNFPASSFGIHYPSSTANPQAFLPSYQNNRAVATSASAPNDETRPSFKFPVPPTAAAPADLKAFDFDPSDPKPVPNSLFIESDKTFLDPTQNFLRSRCIEIFAADEDDITSPGSGAHPVKAGQVGLRCYFCKGMAPRDLARQAICYPSRRDTIFESVRNFQRTHLHACPEIPIGVKDKSKELALQGSLLKRPQKVLKAYYAEAASELGLVDSSFGLMFSDSQNKTAHPSEALNGIMEAAESSAKFASFIQSKSACKDEAIKMRKFEHVASDETREVLVNARKQPTVFCHPSDFPTISDMDFLLFHQTQPVKPSVEKIQFRGLDLEKFRTLAGLCCKHCANSRRKGTGRKGAYFPTDLDSLKDSGFSQNLFNHLMDCPHVPKKIQDSLEELKLLAAEHGISTKRGSKRNFFKKVWGRMENYYAD